MQTIKKKRNNAIDFSTRNILLAILTRAKEFKSNAGLLHDILNVEVLLRPAKELLLRGTYQISKTKQFNVELAKLASMIALASTSLLFKIRRKNCAEEKITKEHFDQDTHYVLNAGDAIIVEGFKDPSQEELLTGRIQGIKGEGGWEISYKVFEFVL